MGDFFLKKIKKFILYPEHPPRFWILGEGQRKVLYLSTASGSEWVFSKTEYPFIKYFPIVCEPRSRLRDDR